MAQTHRPRPEASAPEQFSRESYGGVTWPHRLAWVTAGATVFLLFVGGLVTSLGAGLAVPDWPTTFGHNMFLFPWSEMVGGVFYEHSHRLLASGVGLLTILLAGGLWFYERRRWVRWLAVAALGLVVFQGILGGLRVVLIEETFAILHACFAQAFFALVVSLAQFTSAGWNTTPRGAPAAETSSLGLLSVAAALLIYGQAIFGALLRHAGTMLTPHLGIAGLIAALTLWLVASVGRLRAAHPELWRPALLLGWLLVGQALLGGASYAGKFWGWFSLTTVVLITTSHMVTGALMFATTIVLSLRSYRISAPADLAGAPSPMLASAPGASERTSS
jgi:heme a synthase